VPEYAQRAAGTRGNLAWILMDLDRFPEAEAQARASTEALQRLWDAYPAVLLFGDNLGNGFNDLARILRRLGRYSDAEKAYRAGIDVFDSTTAHTHGSQMESRRYEDRTIALLRRAVAMGFKERKLLARDQDRSALRHHPDFQILIMDLAIPIDPFRK
jgi:tetratricopeptide (TPR) repeat protein